MIGISEIEEIFEQIKFEQDLVKNSIIYLKDLTLWITLKTCYATEAD